MINKRQQFRKVANTALNLFNGISIIIIAFLLLRVFVFGSYRIPTDSMIPAIIPGDYVLVNKLAYGARLFNLFDALEGKRVKIRRIFGYTHVKHNDVVVFHIPHPHKRDKIEMDMFKYYIKRCIGIPGDTLRIVNGIYQINSDTVQHYGNFLAEQKLSQISEQDFSKYLYQSFPKDTILRWNIKNFGPMYIPCKGDCIRLSRTETLIYKKIIEWETGHTLHIERDILYNGDIPITSYTFTHNYYFMGGDKVENSQDSRYWGLLPDELIIGKASFIWKSIDPDSHQVRWERFMKSIR